MKFTHFFENAFLFFLICKNTIKFDLATDTRAYDGLENADHLFLAMKVAVRFK